MRMHFLVASTRLHPSTQQIVAGHGERRTDDYRSEQQSAAIVEYARPGKHPMHRVRIEPQLGWQMMRMRREPKANLIFDPKEDRNEGQNDIVQRHTDDCREFIRSQQPCAQDGEQRFETKERSEAEEDSNREAQCDRMRRITNGVQLAKN